MESGRDQNRGTESASTSTPQPARGTALPTNLPATIPLEFLEQMFKALQPDVDVSQTLVYLAQTAQPSTSAVAQETVTLPTQTMPSATKGLAGEGGKMPTEDTAEEVVEEEPPQQSIQTREEELEIRDEGDDEATAGEARCITEVPERDTVHANMGEEIAASVRNPEQGDTLGGGVIPLQIDDFPGQLASPLPVLSHPVEMSPLGEEVPLLKGPSRP